MDERKKKLEEHDEEMQRMRRIHNLRDRDRRTNKNTGCSINAMIAVLVLAAVAVFVVIM